MAVGLTLQTVVLYADIQIKPSFHHNSITFGKSARVENVENHNLLRMVKDGGSRSWKTAFLLLLSQADCLALPWPPYSDPPNPFSI